MGWIWRCSATTALSYKPREVFDKRLNELRSQQKGVHKFSTASKKATEALYHEVLCIAEAGNGTSSTATAKSWQKVYRYSSSHTFQEPDILFILLILIFFEQLFALFQRWKEKWVGGRLTKQIEKLYRPHMFIYFKIVFPHIKRCHFIPYSTYQLRKWAPRPPGRRCRSCSRPACEPDRAPRGTTADTAVLGQTRGRAPWTDRPEGRRARTGTAGWGGCAAARSSRRRGCSGSWASERPLGWRPPPEPPGERTGRRVGGVRNTAGKREVFHQNFVIWKMSWWKNSYWRVKERERKLQDRMYRKNFLWSCFSI